MIVQLQCHLLPRLLNSIQGIIEDQLCSGTNFKIQSFLHSISRILLNYCCCWYLYYIYRETNSPIIPITPITPMTPLTPITQIDSPLKQTQQPFLYGFSRSNSPVSSDNSANSIPNYNTNNNGCNNGSLHLTNNNNNNSNPNINHLNNNAITNTDTNNSIDSSHLLELMVIILLSGVHLPKLI